MEILSIVVQITLAVILVTALPPQKQTIHLQAPTVPSSECRSLMDLVLVVDGSDSISAQDYDKQRAALANLVKDLDIGPRMARVGIVVYSTGIAQVIPISANKKRLVREMYKLSHPRDGTNTALGIEKMIELYAKDARVNVPWVCIVITDGISKNPDDTAAQSARARELGINMFAVGISHDIRQSELEAIATVPKQVLMLTSFDQLAVSLTSLMKVVCPCPPPPPVDFATVEDGSRTIGSSLLYTCDPGYQQMGEQPIISCGADSTWTTMDFSCLACPEPIPDYANGIVIAGAILLNTTRQYKCKKGYTSPGPVEVTCIPGPEGPSWTDPQLKCAACQLPPAMANAFVDAGPKGGSLIGTTRPYTCAPGFIPTGPMETICVDNNGHPRWTNLKSRCIACDYPPIVPNADVSIKGDNLVGSVRSYNCLPGFSPTGPIEAVCLGRGGKTFWEVTKHRCITCSHPPDLPNAVPDNTGNLLVGAVRKYSCQKGFQPSGPIKVLCVANNGVTFWDGPDNKCIACPVPPVVSHAVLKPSGDTLIGSVRGYACKKGYLPTGPIEIGCRSGPTGPYWTPQENECITCDTPPVLPNAVLEVNGNNMIGSMRRYRCVDGFSPSKPGPITLECKGEYVDNQGRAFWSYPSHQCIACPDPPPMKSARVLPGDNILGAVRTYECEEGFFATGPIVAKCLDSVKWSVPENSCTACGPTPLVPHGYVLNGTHLTGTVRTYQCDDGYVPTTKPTINCTQDANWSPVEFACVKCKDPYPVKFSVLEPGNTLVGTIRHYTCLPGYLSTGPISSTCAVPKDIKIPDWSTPVHFCKDCGQPYPVDFAHPMPGPHTMGAVMHYKCDDGFVPSNQPLSHCMPNGEWSPPNFKCIKPPTLKSFDADTSSHRRRPSPRRNRRPRPQHLSGPPDSLDDKTAETKDHSNNTTPRVAIRPPMSEFGKHTVSSPNRYTIQRKLVGPPPLLPAEANPVETPSTYTGLTFNFPPKMSPMNMYHVPSKHQKINYYIPPRPPHADGFGFKDNSFDMPSLLPPIAPGFSKWFNDIPPMHSIPIFIPRPLPPPPATKHFVISPLPPPKTKFVMPPPPKFVRPPQNRKVILPPPPKSKYLPPRKHKSKFMIPPPPKSKYLHPRKHKSKFMIPPPPKSKFVPPSKYKSKFMIPPPPKSKYLPPRKHKSKFMIPPPQKSKYLPTRKHKSTFMIPPPPKSKYLPPRKHKSKFFIPQPPKSKFVMPSPLEANFIMPPPPKAKFVQRPMFNVGKFRAPKINKWAKWYVPPVRRINTRLGHKHRMPWVSKKYSPHAFFQYPKYRKMPFNLFSHTYNMVHLPYVRPFAAPYSLIFNYFRRHVPARPKFFRFKSKKNPMSYFAGTGKF